MLSKRRHFWMCLFVLLLGIGLGAAPAQAQFDQVKDKVKEQVDQEEEAEASTPSTAEEDSTAPTEEQAIEDANAFMAVYDEHKDAFRQLQGFDYSYMSGWPEEGETWWAVIQDVEGRYDEIQTAMRTMAERYGEDGDAINSTYRDLGLGSSYAYGWSTSPGSAFRTLREGMEKVAQFRQYVAEDAAADAERDMRLIDEGFYVTDMRVETAKKMKEQLTLAHKFDPHNEDVNAMLARIDDYIDDVREDVAAEIDAAEWPGHAAGAPSQHAQAALQYFRDHEEWGQKEGVEVLAVAVRGGWLPAEHNILGEVIQWRLPVLVAATKPQWKEMDAARVYDLSVLAQKNNPAPKQPPFAGYWVGDSYLIRLGKLPK